MNMSQVEKGLFEKYEGVESLSKVSNTLKYEQMYLLNLAILNHEFLWQGIVEKVQELNSMLDWKEISEVIKDIVLESISYESVENELLYNNEKYEIQDIYKQIEKVKTFIENIFIFSDKDSKYINSLLSYESSSSFFKSVFDFYTGAKDSDAMEMEIVNVVKKELEHNIENTPKKPIAVYVISNNGSLFLYEIQDDYVIAGVDWNSREKFAIEGTGFKYGEIKIDFSECLRI